MFNFILIPSHPHQFLANICLCSISRNSNHLKHLPRLPGTTPVGHKIAIVVVGVVVLIAVYVLSVMLEYVSAFFFLPYSNHAGRHHAVCQKPTCVGVQREPPTTGINEPRDNIGQWKFKHGRRSSRLLQLHHPSHRKTTTAAAFVEGVPDDGFGCFYKCGQKIFLPTWTKFCWIFSGLSNIVPRASVLSIRQNPQFRIPYHCGSFYGQMWDSVNLLCCEFATRAGENTSIGWNKDNQFSMHAWHVL